MAAGNLEPNVNAVFGSTVLTGREALLKRLNVSASDRVLNCGCVYKDPIAYDGLAAGEIKKRANYDD